MAHRNVHVFKQEPRVTVYNKRYAPHPPVQQPKADKNQSIWPFIAAGVAGLALGVIGNLPKKTPVEKTPDKPVNNNSDNNVPYKRDNTPIPELPPRSPQQVNIYTPGPEPSKIDQYNIYKLNTSQTYKIQKYDTWYLIAGAKYNIPEGVTLKDVQAALQRANFDGTEEEFMNARNTTGILFYPNDIINLPNILNINGIEVPLFEDHENRKINRKEYQFALSEYRTAKVGQSGTEFYVVVNGQFDTKLGPFPTREAAQKKINELKEQADS